MFVLKCNVSLTVYIFSALTHEECSKSHELGFRLVCFLVTRWQKSIVSKMNILTLSICEVFIII